MWWHDPTFLDGIILGVFVGFFIGGLFATYLHMRRNKKEK